MGYSATGSVVLLCTLLCRVASIDVQGLPQGLLQRKMDLGITTEVWKVVITVEDSSSQWEQVMRVVTSLTDLNVPGLDPWSRSQLLQLRDRINHLNQSHQRRQKRGLIDGIGTVAHSLFGLATDSEVSDLREKIEENRRWQQTMSTWSDDFVVIINKTREDMAMNRAVLNNITEQTLKSIDHIHLIMTLQDQVHQLELINRRTNNIIDDLEHGLLTELIQPRTTLSSIVDGSIALEWYYRWCSISPLWNEGWVFETRLPIVSQEPIIGYELIAFPVWGPGNLTVKWDIARYAALDTASGTVTEPRACHGNDPVVCSRGIHIEDGCATAVV